MSVAISRAALIGIVAIAPMAEFLGCATVPLAIAKEPAALEVALKRARFEMNCPQATGAMLAKQAIAPITSAGGGERVEFTIGVSGCDQRATLVVICAEQADSCFTADGRRR